MSTRQPPAAAHTAVLPADTFGDALKFLRKRARLTQDELGRAVGYSREQIARLESGSRLPDLTVIAALFVAALGLEREPQIVIQLLHLAGLTRSGDDGVQRDAVQRVTITRTVRRRMTLDEATVTGILPLSQPAALPAPAPADRHQLPAPMLPLIGRAANVAQACDLLLHEARLLTLVGPPGVGKTRLALEIAHTQAQHFAHGACFVPLAPVQAIADFPGAVAVALGLTPAAGQTPERAVATHLAPRTLLLVLDNCEHLLDAAPWVAEWLAAAPGLKVLCTSRTALDLYGEYELEAPPLALPELAELPEVAALAHVPAVQLFVTRMRAADASFALSAANALAVATLCVALDGLPLALELAAARGRELAPQELMQQLVAARSRHQLASTVLVQTKRGIAERHRTLHDAIAWSYRLLTPTEQQVFERLGVFAGGCMLHAAEAVCATDDATLHSLAAASLIQFGEPATGPRITMLETLGAFATEQLAVTGELAAAQRRHATYYADFAQAVFAGVRSADPLTWLAQARREQDNCRAALRFALQDDDPNLAVTIAGGLWWFWYRQGFLAEGLGWLDASLRHQAERVDPATLPAHQQHLRAIALNGAGSMANEIADYAGALAYHAEGLALRQAMADHHGAAITLHNMGLVARCQGDYPRALELFHAAMAADAVATQGEAVDDPMTWANIGIVAHEMDDQPLARSSLEKALAQAQVQDDPWIVAFVAGNLCDVLRSQGELVQAAEMARTSLALFTQLGDAQYTPEPQLILAKIALADGDIAQARQDCAAALAEYRALGDRHGVASALYLLAWILLEQGADEATAVQAARLFGAARALRDGITRVVPPIEQAEHTHVFDLLAQRLGEPARSAHIAAGRQADWVALI